MPIQIKTAAIGIVFNSERDAILLVKRRDVPLWVLPGGGVEKEESSEEAAIREVLEETGLQVRVTRKVAEYRPINRLAEFTELFECATLGGRLQTGRETKEVRFFSLEQLPSTLFFLHREWLKEAIEHKTTLIRKPITQITYFALFKYFLKHPLLVTRFAASLLGYPINAKD